MGKKKTLHAGMKWLLLLVQHLLAGIATTAVVVLVSSLLIVDETDRYHQNYDFDLFQSAETFEETNVFSELFLAHVDQVVTNVVIGSQIGEDGKYDGNYLVDIGAYANRKNLETENAISVEYRLADLLKWYGNGMTYEIVNNKDNVSLFEYEAPDVALLKEEFLPVDGVSLRERADSEEEYYAMVADLEQSVTDLGYNMSFFNARKDKFEKKNSNFQYFFVMENEDGRNRIFTNAEVKSEEAQAHFKALGAYAMYDTRTLAFETNVEDFTSLYLQQELNAHAYVYEKVNLIYIGVDTDYPVSDIYAKAKESFETIQYAWYYIIALVAAVFLWFAILGYISVMTGRKKQEDGSVAIEANWVDYLPTELFGIIFLGVCTVVVAFCILICEETSVLFFKTEGHMLRVGLIAIGIFGSIWCSGFWYSLVRRFKMHTVLKYSLCGMLLSGLWKRFRKLCGRLKAVIMACYDNAGTVTRVVVPMAIVILVNFFGGFVSLYLIGVYGRGSGLLLGFCSILAVILVDVLYTYCIAKSDLCRKSIVNGIIRIREGEMDYQLDTKEMHGENLELGEAVNSIGKGIKKAVEASMKNERLKADLITNVSHDIKTPLTSIINYVDLLKREKIETEPVKSYIEVLDAKSQRLKQLTDDLVEASKISSGNIVLNFEKIKLKELLMQSVGEFSEKFEQKNLTIVESYTEEEIFITADPARMWRVIENLFNNIFKYSLEGTRVYVELAKDAQKEQNQVTLSIKNISKNPLKVRPDELTERFIRGDESRTTEGSGLGLSIAQNLMELQGGKLDIYLDGDLFKVVLNFRETLE